jgi:hypothetical protein
VCCFILDESGSTGNLDQPQYFEICKLLCSPQLADENEHGQKNGFFPVKKKLDSSY